MEDMSPAFVGLAAAAAYFIPSMVAFRRGVPYFGVLMAVNTVIGWTGFGWLLVLAWAAAAPSRHRACPGCFAENPLYANLCGVCGCNLAVLPRCCPACGVAVRKDATECRSCAAPLEATAGLLAVGPR
jgi:hypothetical protein